MADKISKNEAVRLALVELGKDAPRRQIQGFVKERFGFDLKLNHVSAARVAAIRKLAAAPEPQVKPVVATSNGKGDIALDDILALRALMDQVGAEQLRTLIDVFAGR